MGYDIWVKCLVNKLSEITDVKIGFIRHLCNPKKVR